MDESNNHGQPYSLLSPDPLLGEETKDGNKAGQGPGAKSFTITTSKNVKIDVKTLADVISSVPPAREWTIEGILPNSGLAIVGGRQKRGKSTLVIHAGRSVEAGDDFLDRPTDKRPVVYINYEMPTDYFVSLSNHQPVPDHFYVIERPEPKLNMVTIEAIIDEMKKREFSKGVMVIDSFRGAFQLEADKENQAGSVGQILRKLQSLGLDKTWLIIVIHHHKKAADAEGSDNLSGSGDFGAAADVIWTWSRPSEPKKPGLLQIEGRIPPVDPMRVSLSPEECKYLGSVNEATEEHDKQRIEDALGTEQLTAKDLAAKTNIPYSTIKKRLDSMEKETRVSSVPGPGKGSPSLWSKGPRESSAPDIQAT